jgi:hypothetical protein
MLQSKDLKPLDPAAILADLQRQGFYGSVEFVFQAGRIVLVRKTETLKMPPEDRRENRGADGEPGTK